MRPNSPMADSRVSASDLCCFASNSPFQKPKAQWSLKEAILHRIPLYMKCGNPYFSSSCTSGHPACTTDRRCLKIGLAKSADLATVSYTHLRAHETPEHLVCR